VLLDGVLGTGIKPPLKGLVAQVLSRRSRFSSGPRTAPMWSPSTVRPAWIAIQARQPPNALRQILRSLWPPSSTAWCSYPAYELIGEMRVVDIGLPPGLASLDAVQAEVAEADSIASILPARPNDAHKGTFGTALIAAGSVSYTGAASLAGKAAYRNWSGTGDPGGASITSPHPGQRISRSDVDHLAAAIRSDLS